MILCLTFPGQERGGSPSRELRPALITKHMDGQVSHSPGQGSHLRKAKYSGNLFQLAPVMFHAGIETKRRRKLRISRRRTTWLSMDQMFSLPGPGEELVGRGAAPQGHSERTPYTSSLQPWEQTCETAKKQGGREGGPLPLPGYKERVSQAGEAP